MRLPSLLTPALTTNWMPFVLVRTPTGFSVAPRPTPRLAISATGGLIGMASIGLVMLAHHKTGWAGAFWPFLGIGILTTVGTALAIVLHFRYQQRLGPVLVFDARHKTLDLPRVKKRITLAEVELFCLVSACSGSDWCSQLQLHTRQGECFLLVSAWTRKELEPMLKGILSEVPVQACFYTEDGKSPDGWREESFNMA